MKTIYYKLLLLLVVAALAAPFILRDDYGRPLMTVDQLHMPDLFTPELPDVGNIVDQARRKLQTAQEEGEARRTTVYKWRDASGLWHYSNDIRSGGTDGVMAEAVQLDPDVNLVRYESRDEPRQPPGTAASSSVTTEEDAADESGLSLRQAPELLERARQVDQLLERREARQRRVLDRM